ncbi:hypothetical protein [Cutibacterium sp.]|uniref:hypothetical protein n=1 Tax=Cutibacterium sp. TaxID=1912221 RepID=UPI0026DBADD4|nr:hypothetical protein [Cutibacterium sp.]MDO4413141.1 hypothetical protein [Cutibacterium sp.]
MASRNTASSFVPGTGVADAFTNLNPSAPGVELVDALAAGVTPPIDPDEPPPPHPLTPTTIPAKTAIVATHRLQRPTCSPFITMATILEAHTTGENPHSQNLWTTRKICGQDHQTM